MPTLKGGTFKQLAGDYGTTARELQKLNPNLRADTTYTVGEVKFPGAQVTTSQPSAQPVASQPPQPQQPSQHQTDLSKVPTQGIGPDGKPIYDVFAGGQHIADPIDPRLKGVDIAGLPEGQAPGGFRSKFEQGFQNASAVLGEQGKDVKAEQGAALTTQYASARTNDFSSNFVKQDEFLGGLTKAFQDYMDPKNQRVSLRSEYERIKMLTGIQAIDMELVDMKRILEGTTDDIRQEITAVGGVANESQVIALSNVRSRQLIKNYNVLLDTRNAKEKYLNTALQLEQVDRQSADQRFESMFNMGIQIADYQQKMKKNAIESFDRTISAIGWGGLANIISPYEAGLLEQAYNLPKGGFLQAVERETKAKAQAEQDRQLGLEEKRVGIQLKGEQVKTEGVQRAKIAADTAKLLAETPGTPANEAKRKAALSSQATKAGVVLAKVDQATKAAGFGSTGFLGGIMGKFGGTRATNLQGYLDTIQANLGFDQLQEMRNASKTGGALGQVAVQELEMLQATVSSLKKKQDASVLKQSLEDVKTHYTNWLNANGYDVDERTGKIYEITN